MITKLYLVRHGQSQANLEHRYAGHTDIPLSNLGVAQAEATGEYMKDIPLDVILSSDLQRAWQTALPIARNHDLPVLPDPDFRELYGGRWEKITVAEMEEQYTEARRIWREDWVNAVCPEGESVRQLFVRAKKLLQKIAQKYPDRSVCVTTHAALTRCLTQAAAGLEAESVNDIPFPANASVTEAVCEDGVWRLVEFSREDHLKKMITKVE